MKGHIISMVIVLVMALTAFGQDEEAAAQRGQAEGMGERFQNMSEQEREQLRAQMRQSFGLGGWGLGWDAQLATIKTIEEQVVKLKATVEVMRSETRDRSRELSEEERAKSSEEMMAAMRERQEAIGAIEEQIAKLKGPVRRRRLEPKASLGELSAIYELAVKEKATETAKRLEGLIAAYQRGRGRTPPEQKQRPPRDRQMEQGEATSRRKAPGFTLNSFDGKTVSLSDYKGKIVVLEWFNSECPFVLYHYDTATTMVELASEYKAEGVVWLAINSTSHITVEANKEFAEKHKLPYIILDDRSGQVGHAYGAKTTPHMFVIDQQGNIAYEGAIDNSPRGRTPAGQELINYVQRALAELTAGEAVSKEQTSPYGCSVKYAK